MRKGSAAEAVVVAIKPASIRAARIIVTPQLTNICAAEYA
jgi:hypothetical protein